MRQLKFRVWDTLAKHYIYPEDRLAAAHCIISLDGKVYNLQNGAGSPELVIQEWTGLTDKNGKDIYEGDILNTDKAVGAGQIEWSDFWGAFSFKNQKGAYQLVAINNSEEWSLSSQLNGVVVGNVNQNPELL